MQIVVHPNPLLRAHADPVPHVGRRERQLFKRMLTNMRKWNGVGLAAPQVGHLLRMIVAEAEGDTVALANPTILENIGMDRMVEGCLSLPGRQVDVARAASIWVKAINEKNQQVEFQKHGLIARILQHEIDHLDGVLIIDRGSDIPAVSTRKQEVSA